MYPRLAMRLYSLISKMLSDIERLEKKYNMEIDTIKRKLEYKDYGSLVVIFHKREHYFSINFLWRDYELSITDMWSYTFDFDDAKTNSFDDVLFSVIQKLNWWDVIYGNILQHDDI